MKKFYKGADGRCKVRVYEVRSKSEKELEKLIEYMSVDGFEPIDGIDFDDYDNEYYVAFSIEDTRDKEVFEYDYKAFKKTA